MGGADTKFVHLLPLLAKEYEVTVVPNRQEQYEQMEWRAWLDGLGVRACRREELPARLAGWAVSLCNVNFLKDGIAMDMKLRGLKVAWSSEMMWHHEGELGCTLLRLFDKVLYVSPVQRAVLEPGYICAVNHTEPDGIPIETMGGQFCGSIPATGGNAPLPWVITGNYVDPSRFPFFDRAVCREPDAPLVIGRLSRPDPDKFPDDFPEFYEGLGVDSVKFRVMAWSEQLAERWKGHRFDDRWDLLPQLTEDTVPFLHSLDVFVYQLGSRFSESWGRAVVEAMLTGVVPVVSRDSRHHLRNLVTHGESGFLCDSPEDFGKWTRLLARDAALRHRMSRQAREHAVTKLCDAEAHRRLWRLVFDEDQPAA